MHPSPVESPPARGPGAHTWPSDAPRTPASGIGRTEPLGHARGDVRGFHLLHRYPASTCSVPGTAPGSEGWEAIKPPSEEETG